MEPENRPSQKEISSSNFQPLIFRCELLVLGRVCFVFEKGYKFFNPAGNVIHTLT